MKVILTLKERELVLKSADLLDADTKDVEARIEALLLEEELVNSKPDWLQNPICAKAENTIVRSLHNQNKAHSSLPLYSSGESN